MKPKPVVQMISHVLAALVLVSFTFAALAQKNPIITSSRDGKLAYAADERGNRIPDFSTSGYAGGDRAIPDAPVRIVISPINGDETERIQRALDYVASLPSLSNGLRGAVLLLK